MSRMVLKVLREHTLFAKQSKCSFGQENVSYLGHLIESKGVSADPEKIEAMAMLANYLTPLRL